MFYTIRGEVDGFEDTSYDRPKKGSKTGEMETVNKWRVALSVPGTSDLVSVDLAVDVAPDTNKQEKWEDTRQFVTVTADTMRHAKGETDGRAWSMISFNGVKIEEINPSELAAIQKARREMKKAKKAAAAKAKKDAADAAAKAAK